MSKRAWTTCGCDIDSPVCDAHHQLYALAPEMAEAILRFSEFGVDWHKLHNVAEKLRAIGNKGPANPG